MKGKLVLLKTLGLNAIVVAFVWYLLKWRKTLGWLKRLALNLGISKPPHQQQRALKFALAQEELADPSSPTGAQRVTFAQHTTKQCKSFPEAAIILRRIENAVQEIAAHTQTLGIGSYDKHGVNLGDVESLAQMAHDTFADALRPLKFVRSFVSGGQEMATSFKGHERGTWSVVCDPLDGSQNADAGVNVGSIFAIYSHQDGGRQWGAHGQYHGRRIVAAGYAMYGFCTNLVVSTGRGVNCFTLDPTKGEFVLTRANITIPQKGRVYSTNEGIAPKWEPCIQEYVTSLKTRKSAYSLRYIGTMVADMHRTILRGGIFMYPGNLSPLTLITPHSPLTLFMYPGMY
jgi:fructose-1,6-bisphosphatase I